MPTIFLLENLKGRDHSEDLGVDGRTVLECISTMVWTVFMWPMIGSVVGPCEHGNEILGSVKGGEFLD
jgi:hypothetical protein